MTFGPIDPSITGKSIDLPVALSVRVIVPLTVPRFVLLPSMGCTSIETPAGELAPGELASGPGE